MQIRFFPAGVEMRFALFILRLGKILFCMALLLLSSWFVLNALDLQAQADAAIRITSSVRP